MQTLMKRKSVYVKSRKLDLRAKKVTHDKEGILHNDKKANSLRRENSPKSVCT